MLAGLSGLCLYRMNLYLLFSVNKPAGVANVKGDNVQASPDIEIEGEQYRQLNTVFNKMQSIAGVTYFTQTI